MVISEKLLKLAEEAEEALKEKFRHFDSVSFINTNGIIFFYSAVTYFFIWALHEENCICVSIPVSTSMSFHPPIHL